MNDFLRSAIKQFKYYKELGEKTMDQLSEQELFWEPNNESNSIAIIMKHLSGNMLSRWTDFLNSDGEKKWRNRESEFENDIKNKEQILKIWNKGWNCLFNTLDNLNYNDLDKEIYIRNMGHSVTEAINRQLCHYSYHIGQIVFIGKLIKKDQWISLSISKGNSKTYNDSKFSKPKRRTHFTDDL